MRSTILVVDDNQMVREVMGRVLDAAGYHSVMAEDGTHALGVFPRHSFDAAIVDVDMPGMNGVEVCRALRGQAVAAGRVVPIWLMTGVVRPDLIKNARAAGALGVLAKPFSMRELIDCIQSRLSPVEHAVA